MLSMTGDVGGRTFAHASRAQSANCAHLHSAFGPGCPYCRQGAADAAPNADFHAAHSALFSDELSVARGGSAQVSRFGRHGANCCRCGDLAAMASVTVSGCSGP
jgi:hypothetical protein